jgi:dihydroflavonol-4-reductase
MITLVTGATGFLGATLTTRLIQEGVRVRGLRRHSSSLDLFEANVADRVDWMMADIEDPSTLEIAFRGVSRVYHCAAFLDFRGKKSRQRLFEVNVRGTANVVNVALSEGVDRIVHTSSVAALGRKDHAGDTTDENAVWQESRYNTQYGWSKYLAELEVQRGVAEGLDAVIVNPSLIMGCGRQGENTTQLVELIGAGKLHFFPGGATNAVDVLDVVDGMMRAMESGKSGRRYILAGSNLSWSELIETVARALGVDPPKRSLSGRIMMTAALASEIAAFILRTRPLITRESARLSASVSRYDNSRAILELGCSFRPFEQTAYRIAAALNS